jgi:uncharacterized protein (DUF1499 family)
MTDTADDAIETPAEETPNTSGSTSRSSRTATAAHYLLVVAIVLLVASPLTNQLGLVDFTVAIPMFLAGAVVTLLAILVGIGGIVTTRSAAGRGKALTALVGGIIIIGITVLMIAPNMSNPPIHDITTDTVNAPEFVALRTARDAAPNETDYEGGDVAAQQLAAFPNLMTFVSTQPGRNVFDASEQIARDMGWEIAAAVPAEGRIEATATTRIFGYKDDVVIRIRPTMDGTTVVDVRSASRVGGGDLGANAARITEFLTALQAAL